MARKIQLESFKIVGISVGTTNENGKASTDLGNLWQKFYSENISSKILNKADNDLYSLYTDYELDYTAGYTAILGHKVSSLDNIPEGLTGHEITGGSYLVFEAKGEKPMAVINTWKEIWDKDKELNRLYSTDFEVYGDKSQDDLNSVVDIYIAMK
ncbi:GyrI-like domain-containing protein [Segetibacter sp.]|jgi:predicted transcriptional regulator YdeE|uniref:GyrI-like domain-containing protein n=1 Tax=Segetibacter sp. TaxID=2231182 RepID=UPI0026283A1E|nr:GyrI-like domain-containing protein [Segetibacter sp.]MCW3079219.1 hypothetical protein [Segetibacter sp.]